MRARCSFGSCVVTPTGHLLVWHRWDWMQPTANMNARAELHQSAPIAIERAIAEAVTILPLAPILNRSRTPAPTRVFCTTMQAFGERDAQGVGELQRRRTGAALATVDDDEVGVDAGLDHRLDDARELRGSPMQILKPTGLPSQSSRSCAMNAHISSGVENALW